MKAGTAASIIAYTILQSRTESLNGSVGLMAVLDEETGGKRGTRYFLEIGDNPSRLLGDTIGTANLVASDRSDLAKRAH